MLKTLTTLPDQNRTIPQTLKDDIAVKYIELKKTFEGKIELTDREVELESIISTRLTKSADIVASLSELILQINQEYSGRPMTESETLCVDKLVNSILYDDEIISHFKEHGNTLDNILLFSSFKDEFNEKLAKVLRYNEELYVNIKNNETWRTSILETVAKTIKENISKTNKLELSVISNDIDENKESYRRALDSCHDYVWFEDRFLNTDSLSLFENVIKNPKVKSIRILTSLVRNKKINNEFLNKILEYKKILDQKEVTFEVKIVSTKRLHKKMHNRYVLGSNILWDLPPVGLVLDGDSSSIFNDFNNSTKSYEKISKDYGEWWNDPEALEITANWHIIKSLVELYSENLYEDREMHEAKCTICGKVIKVPFIPRPNMPVYCHEHRKLKRSR